MKSSFLILGLIFGFLAFGSFVNAKSAMHETTAAVLALITIACFSTFSILDELVTQRHKAAESRAEWQATIAANVREIREGASASSELAAQLLTNGNELMATVAERIAYGNTLVKWQCDRLAEKPPST